MLNNINYTNGNKNTMNLNNYYFKQSSQNNKNQIYNTESANMVPVPQNNRIVSKYNQKLNKLNQIREKL